MNCQRYDKYIFDYCEDNLSPALKEQIDKHLQECYYCKNQVKLTHLENAVLGDKSDLPSLADDFTDRVMQHIVGFRATQPLHSAENKKKTRARGIALATAAVGLVMLMAILVPQILPFQKSAQIADSPPVSSERHTLNDSSTDAIQNESLPTPSHQSTSDDYTSTGALPELDRQEDVAPPIKVADVMESTTPAVEEMSIESRVSEPMSTTFDVELFRADYPETDSYWKSGDLQTPSRLGSNEAAANKLRHYAQIPAPQQVPGHFTLINTVNSYSPEGSTVEYHYTDKSSRTLIITLQNLKERERNVNVTGAPGASGVPNFAGSNSIDEKLVMTYYVEIDGQPYQVTLEGSVSAEDLVDLAEAITFTAGNPTSH